MKSRFFELLNQGDFDGADQILMSGQNINSHDYRVDVGYDDEQWVTRSFNFLEEAFAARRLDIVDYLLNRGANFAICSSKILSSLLQVNPIYAYSAFEILVKYQGDGLLHAVAGNDQGNFLHYLATTAELSPAQKSYGPSAYHFTPNTDFMASGLVFNYTSEQLQSLLGKFNINQIVINSKNKDGDTPLHKAIKNGHVGLVQWLVNTKLINYFAINGNAKKAAELADYAGPDIRRIVAEGLKQKELNQTIGVDGTSLMSKNPCGLFNSSPTMQPANMFKPSKAM